MCNAEGRVVDIGQVFGMRGKRIHRNEIKHTTLSLNVQKKKKNVYKYNKNRLIVE